MSSLVVFNPLSFARQDLVDVALKLPDQVEAFELVDGEGASIAYEFVGGQHEELREPRCRDPGSSATPSARSARGGSRGRP